MLKISVIDDEVHLCQLLGDFLEAYHYPVSCFTKANDSIEQNFGQADVIFVDLNMKVHNGRELANLFVAQKLKNNQIPYAVVFISGYQAQEIAVSGLAPDCVHFLEKPFTSENMFELLEKIAAKYSEVTKKAG